MVVPGMFDMPTVMAESGLTEDDVLNLGFEADGLVFMVVVPELGACRVPDVALSHFMAGDDEYTADGMPEHWSNRPSGPWTVKRDRLRILADSWEKHLSDVLASGNALDGRFEYTIDEDGGATTFLATPEEFKAIVTRKNEQRDERCVFR